MPSRGVIRNRLAKPLPDHWRQWLLDQGVPKRKYTAVLRAEVIGGRVVDELVVEEGWIIALDRSQLADAFEQRIDFDPRDIENLAIVKVI